MSSFFHALIPLITAIALLIILGCIIKFDSFIKQRKLNKQQSIKQNINIMTDLTNNTITNQTIQPNNSQHSPQQESINQIVQETPSNIIINDNIDIINNDNVLDTNKDFDKVLYNMKTLHDSKNGDYGNAFEKLFQEYGLVYAIAHLDEKLYRIKSVHKNNKANNESIKDSLIDLANYAVMTLIELNKSNIETK